MLLVALPLAFFAVFLLYPLVLMFIVSIRNYVPAQVVGDRLTVENYTRFLLDPFYRGVLLSTLRLVAIVSAAALTIAYPLAYYLSRSTSRAKGWLIFLLLTPLMVEIVVRTYGWIVLLGRNGTINQLLLALGIVREPVRILFTNTAVVLGLIEVLLPSDAGSVLTPHGAAGKEVGMLVRAGLGPLEAIRAATLHAAELLGISDRLGTIEPGKLADIIVVAGDPVSRPDVLGMRRLSGTSSSGESR